MNKRPLALYALTACLLFLGVGALYGGYHLITDATGGSLGMPLSYLAGSVFADYTVPGIFLFTVFGVGSLVALIVLWARPAVSWLNEVSRLTHEHWSWVLTLAIGATLILWIIIQYAVIRQFHPLQAIMAGLGVVIIGLDLLPSVRRYYQE